MKKKITKLGVMLLAVIMLLSTIPVSAANPEISPLRYDNISSMLVSLVISDKGLASCDGQITLRGGASVDMSLTLQKSKNQTNWSDEKTWDCQWLVCCFDRQRLFCGFRLLLQSQVEWNGL